MNWKKILTAGLMVVALVSHGATGRRLHVKDLPVTTNSTGAMIVAETNNGASFGTVQIAVSNLLAGANGGATNLTPWTSDINAAQKNLTNLNEAVLAKITLTNALFGFAQSVVAASGFLGQEILVGNLAAQALAASSLYASGALTNGWGGPGQNLVAVDWEGVGRLVAATNVPASMISGTLKSLAFQTNATEGKINVKAFGAAGDAVVVTNCTISSGSRSVTTIGGNFSAGDIGKTIMIDGAGASGWSLTSIITNVASANSITLSNAASTTVSYRPGVYGSDDTAAISNALYYAALHRGTTIFSPEGIYLIAGALADTGTNSLHHNAQIYFPDLPMDNNMAPQVNLEGPQIPWLKGIGQIGTNMWGAYGACWWSVLPRGPDVNPGRMLDCRNFTSPNAVGFCANLGTLPLNNFTISIRNMGFRGAYDGNIALVDLQGSEGCTLDGVWIDTGWDQGDLQPHELTGTNGIGLKLAGSFNGNLVTGDRIGVRGFYRDIEMGENALLGHVLTEGAIEAIGQGILSGSAPWRIEYLNSQECSNVFVCGPCEFSGTVGFAGIYNQRKYPTTAHLIVDPLNQWKGEMLYQWNNVSNLQHMPWIGAGYVNIKETEPGATGFKPIWQTIHVVDTNSYAQKFWTYNNANPSYNWGTQQLAFAESPRYAGYLIGSQDSFNLWHAGAGGVFFSNDGLDNLTLGISGKTLTLPVGTASTILRLDGSKNLGAVTIGSGLSYDGTTLSASASGGPTFNVNQFSVGGGTNIVSASKQTNNLFYSSAFPNSTKVLGIPGNSILLEVCGLDETSGQAEIYLGTQPNGIGAENWRLGKDWSGQGSASEFYLKASGPSVNARQFGIRTNGQFYFASLAGTGNRILKTDASGFVTPSAGGSVPANLDGTATTVSQIQALYPAGQENVSNGFTPKLILAGVLKLNAPTNAATSVNLGLDANGNVGTNTAPIGNGAALTNTSHTILAGGQNSATLGSSGNAKWALFPISSSTLQTSANAIKWPLPYAATLTNLWVSYNTATGAGTNNTFTVFTNGVATPITLTILGNGSLVQASNLTATVFVPQGVNVEMMISNNAASAASAQNIQWSMEARQ